jgi:hypothetical protein
MGQLFDQTHAMKIDDWYPKVNLVVPRIAPILRTARSGALDDHPVRRRRKLRRRHGRLHRPWQTLNQTQFGIVSLCAVRDRSCRKIPKNIVIVVQDGTIERPVLTAHSAQVIANGVFARLVSRNLAW